MRIKWILITVFVLFALFAVSSIVSAGNVTYSPTNNIITVTGNETGSTPWDFQSLYDADKAGNLTLWIGTLKAIGSFVDAVILF